MLKVAWPDECLYEDWGFSPCTCEQWTLSAPTWGGGHMLKVQDLSSAPLSLEDEP